VIDNLTRTLLLKYDPTNPLLDESPVTVSVEVTKAASTLELTQELALAHFNNSPQCEIDKITAALTAHLGREAS
jgi:hypothetical protein